MEKVLSKLSPNNNLLRVLYDLQESVKDNLILFSYKRLIFLQFVERYKRKVCIALSLTFIDLFCPITIIFGHARLDSMKLRADILFSKGIFIP